MAQRAKEVIAIASSSQDPAPTTEAFLADFSDEDLQEVVVKPDECNEETVRTAEQMLRKRGTEITDAEKAEQEHQRLQEIREPRAGHPGWMIFAFLSILTAFSLAIFT